MISLHQVQLRWLSAEEGGRRTPIVGGMRYTPTARFAGEQDQFSVVLNFRGSDAASPTNGTLRLLFPDLVEIEQRLHPGVVLEIMEGARVTAHAVVEDTGDTVLEIYQRLKNEAAPAGSTE